MHPLFFGGEGLQSFSLFSSPYPLSLSHPHSPSSGTPALCPLPLILGLCLPLFLSYRAGLCSSLWGFVSWVSTPPSLSPFAPPPPSLILSLSTSSLWVSLALTPSRPDVSFSICPWVCGLGFHLPHSHSFPLSLFLSPFLPLPILSPLLFFRPRISMFLHPCLSPSLAPPVWDLSVRPSLCVPHSS